MAVPGYQCLVRRSGSSTAASAEACELVSGTTYRITAAAKRCVDPDVAWSVADGATTLAYSAISSADLVNGEFTLASGPATSVFFTGSYLPLTTSAEVVTEARSFSLSLSRDLLDVTVFAGTSNLHAAVRSRTAGLKDVSLEVESIASHSDLYVFENYKNDGTRLVAEIYQGADGSERFRGYCFVESVEKSGDVGDLIPTTITFKIAATRDSNGFIGTYNFKAQP